MLRGGGVATNGHEPFLREVAGVEPAWDLFVWRSFVDRDAESVAFLDWLSAFVDHEAYGRDRVLGGFSGRGGVRSCPTSCCMTPPKAAS